MSFTYINRDIYPKMLVQDEPLDSNYYQGNSYEEYANNNPAPWIELSKDQLAFKEANPDATAKEIIEMKLDEKRLLDKAKSNKYQEINSYKKDLYQFMLDDNNIYIQEYERREAIINSVVTDKIMIVGHEFGMTEGKILINMMSDYDKELESVFSEKWSQVNSATTVDQVNKIDAHSGYPEKVNTSTSYIVAAAETKDQADPSKMAVMFSMMAVNNKAMALSANEALKLKALFPIWGKKGAEFGLSVDIGFRLRVVKDDSDILYEVIQKHTLAQEWEPGVSTASLYKVVDEEHAGTLDDPIPYFPPMELFKDKYYIQNADKYKCVRNSEIPLSHDLKDLIGHYVEAVQE